MIGAVRTESTKTDPLDAYHEAHGKTEDTLVRLAGLSRALYSLAVENPALVTSDPDCEAILSLIVVIEEKAQQAAEHHTAEWDLIVKPQLT